MAPEGAARDPGVREPELSGDGPLARWACFAQLTLQGLWSHRYQLILTTLTMAVGALTLALTLFIGEGARHRIWADMEELLGTWLVAYDDPGPDDTLLRRRGRADFTEQDLEEVRSRLTEARLITPVYLDQKPVRYGDEVLAMPVDGITPELAREPLYQPISGRPLSSAAHKALTSECLVSDSAAKALELRLEQRPILLVGNERFEVVGVVSDPPRVSKRFLPRVIVPYRYARLHWIRPGSVGHILVSWHHTRDMDTILTRLRETLDEARGPDTYFLSSSQFQIRRGKEVVANIMAVGAIQALFCVIVATIGVVNVMLSAVTRRAHELAVRLAMGARQSELLLSVLSESFILGMTGAVVGLLAAVLAAPSVCELLAGQIPGATLLRPYMSPRGFLLPLAVCGLSSLGAGVIPALKIRKIDVLANLREKV